MEAIRLTHTDDPLFTPVWEIYQNSFPLSEQRTLAHQQTALRSSDFYFMVYREENTIVGLIGYWEIDDYLYIEHYAINPALRGGGYGSRILEDLIRHTPRTVILEIDEVKDEISTRRLHFYQRLGFVMNPYRHPLHRYREGDEHQDAILHILTYPHTIDAATYERFCQDLTDIVMKRD